MSLNKLPIKLYFFQVKYRESLKTFYLFSVLRNFSCQCKLLNEIPWTHKNYLSKHFPHSSVSKESACNAGDPDLIPGSGRFPGEGNGNPLQYSCLDNPMDRGAWQAIVHGVERVGHDLAT